VADIKYIIQVDDKGGIKKIEKLDKTISDVKEQSQKGSSAFSGLWKQFALGLGSVMGLQMAFRKLSGFMKSTIESAKIQELAERNLVVALKSTGREVPKLAEHLEVPKLAEHFKEYAKQIQSATTYGDEQILEAQALLIQLTKLDKEGLDAATKGAVGLASVFKTDLKAATNLVAKALAGNYGALSRYGISVKDLKTDEEKNAWGDAKEQIGDAVIKNQDLLKIIKDLTAKITELIETGKIAEWAKDAASGIITTVNALKLFFDTIKSGKPVIASMSENFADWTMNLMGMKSPQQD